MGKVGEGVGSGGGTVRDGPEEEEEEVCPYR